MENELLLKNRVTLNRILFFLPVFLLLLFVYRVPALETDQKSALHADLAERRASLARTLGDNSLLIVFSAPEQRKTGDVSYEYRQNNNLYYLTGIEQSDTILVLMPGNRERNELLFVQDRVPSAETWTGKILSHDEVTEISGIKNVYSTSQFEQFMENMFRYIPFDTDRYVPTQEYDKFFEALRDGQALVYFVFEEKPGFNAKLTREQEFGKALRERFVGFHVRDAWPLLTRLRQVKSPIEIQVLRQAVDITADALKAAFQTIRPGIWEYEVEAVIEAVYKRRNAFDWGFPSIVASGPNSTTLHYEKSQRRMNEGELILMDVGAEYRYYTADITRTVPVSGKFSAAQREIYQIVYDAQQAAMAAVKPGAKLPDVHTAGTEVVKNGLKRLGLITDTKGDQYKMFFMHGVSHWLGMDVHDTGERWRVLEPGMAFTIEPGIYVRADALDNLPPTAENDKLKDAIRPAFEKYKNIGVRIEDDILVTKDGYENLSAKVPRSIEEIERVMQ